jgi:hypothetical protein
MVASYAGCQVLAALWHLAPLTARPAGLLAGTAAAVALLLLAAAVAGRVRPASRSGRGAFPGSGGAPVRRSRRGGTPRLTDPDAPGRARPRAPCAAPAAAAGSAPA